MIHPTMSQALRGFTPETNPNTNSALIERAEQPDIYAEKRREDARAALAEARTDFYGDDHKEWMD